MGEHRKGVRSSEFWLVIVGVGIAIANERFGLGLDRADILSTTVLITGYSVSRGMAKKPPQ